MDLPKVDVNFYVRLPLLSTAKPSKVRTLVLSGKPLFIVLGHGPLMGKKLDKFLFQSIMVRSGEKDLHRDKHLHCGERGCLLQ